MTKTVDELQANWRQAMSGAHAAWLRERLKDGEVAMTKKTEALRARWLAANALAATGQAAWAAAEARRAAEIKSMDSAISLARRAEEVAWAEYKDALAKDQLL